MLRDLFPSIGRFERIALRALVGLSVIAQMFALVLPTDMIRPLPAAVDGQEALKRDIEGPDHRPPGLVIELDRADELAEVFSGLHSDLPSLRAGDGVVPPVLVARLPSDLAGIRQVAVRKALFFNIVLPLILRENAQIAEDRRQLLALRARPASNLNVDERAWLTKLAWRYQLRRVGEEATPDRETFAGLARRVGRIPVSLAMAQAAEESGWGTSRFAVQGNALFGQWSWKQSDGITPRKRDAGKRHVVRAFDDLSASVTAYMRNLNTNRAYADFRAARASGGGDGSLSDGARLAAFLTRYSERGEVYVQSLRGLIRVNRLDQFDRFRLGDLKLVMGEKVGS